MDKEKIAPALGKIASGLYIATAVLDGKPLGMLCSFVEQAAFEPPMISIALGPTRPLVRALEQSGTFGLHILGKQNNALVKSFSRNDIPDPFDGHAMQENEYDLPQFADAWAFLVCRVANRIEAGDHYVYVAEVLNGVLQKTDEEPMIRIRSNGFFY